MKIKVIDGICGIGKTSSAINYIKESEDDTRFLYITPFLTEVERIKEQCKSKSFYEPKNLGTKIEGVKDLISKGRNIVSTHSLFSNFDEQTIELAYLNNYTLIMDEVAEVIEPLDITKDDLQTILEKYATIGEDGTLVWTAEDYKGEFEKYKRLCDLQCVAVYKDIAFLWMFPISVFKAFKEIYILTYLFKAQMQYYYYQFYNIEFENLYCKDMHFTTEPQLNTTDKYKDLINICDSAKLNRIGDWDYTLSATWYRKNKDNDALRVLKNNCINYFKNITKTKTQDNMWTCFKAYKDDIKGECYSKGFVSLGTRATNNFINKKSLAYLTNTFMHPVVKNFFMERNIEVNEDLYALSELIQWIFRSQIRVCKPIGLYLPSLRMRVILAKWQLGDYD